VEPRGGRIGRVGCRCATQPGPNDAIAGALRLHRATVEKHINSIFLALDLAEEKQVNKRVSAVLLFRRDV